MTLANVQSPRTRPQSSGNARIAILVCLVFLLGMGLGAWWIKRSPRQQPETEAGPLLSLSSRSLDVLKNLDSPVEVRFYSLLNDSNVRESSGAFAADVSLLLAEYQQHGGGKIKVTTIRSESQSDMKAASADGISPFNLEKGDPCYLGIAVIGEGRKESIPRLSPDWADALEFDLTRIIARVSSPQPAPPAAATSTPVDPATRGEVQKLIPDAASVSLDDGRRIIREAAAKEFMDTATELQAKVKAAEERFTQLSQNNASESELKAALDQVRQAQAEQVEKLNEIAVRAQERISAFEQIKSGAR